MLASQVARLWLVLPFSTPVDIRVQTWRLGGTGTYWITGTNARITEVQAGFIRTQGLLPSRAPRGQHSLPLRASKNVEKLGPGLNVWHPVGRPPTRITKVPISAQLPRLVPMERVCWRARIPPTRPNTAGIAPAARRTPAPNLDSPTYRANRSLDFRQPGCHPVRTARLCAIWGKALGLQPSVRRHDH
jgi:hypothetical protein